MTVVGTRDLETAYASHVDLAGNYSGHAWDPANDPKFFESGDGSYKGAITMYDTENRFTS